MKKILIVVDMQNDFIDGSLGTEEAVAIVDNVVKTIEDFDGLVICTRDTHQENYMETSEGRHLPVVHCIENTQGWEIRKEVAEAVEGKEHLIIDKPTFGSEKLIETLKEIEDREGIKDLTLVGLCTDICVVSNALMVKAAFYEKDVKVLEKCCAGVTPDSHEAALTTMRMCQIEVE